PRAERPELGRASLPPAHAQPCIASAPCKSTIILTAGGKALAFVFPVGSIRRRAYRLSPHLEIQAPWSPAASTLRRFARTAPAGRAEWSLAAPAGALSL